MTAIEIIENSKKTHEDWLAYFVKYPDQEKTEEHKHLGDRFFHEQCITNYEKVIKKIQQLQNENKAMKIALDNLSKSFVRIETERDLLQLELKDQTLKGYVETTSPGNQLNDERVFKLIEESES